MSQQRSDYNVNINLRTKDGTAKGTRSAKKGIGDLASVAKLAAAGFTAMKVAQKGLEFVKLGAEALRAGKALDGLAKQAGTSGDAIVGAMQSASGFTIDKMSAMSAANKALMFDIATTPEQFANLAKQATLLGRAMGQDATTSIDDFITAAGRQSKQIADNLGLMVSAEDANLKYADSLGIAVDEMTDAQKKQAFLNDMLRQAESKTAVLDDGTKDLATNMEILNASLETAKTELGELAAGRAAAIVGEDFDDLGQVIRDMPVVVEALGNAWDIYLTRALEDGQTGAFAVAQALVEVREEMDRSSVAAGLAADAANTWQKDEDELRKTLEETSVAVADLAADTPELANGIDLVSAATPKATDATKDLTEALREQIEAAASAAEHQLALSESLLGATDAQIASVAISELGKAVDAETIGTQEYIDAVTEVQLAFGLASDQSITLRDGILDLTGKVAGGQVALSDFDDELAALIVNTDLEHDAVGRLKIGIDALPDKKVIEIEVKYTTTGSAAGDVQLETPQSDGGPPGMAFGGSFMVGERGPEVVTVTPAGHTSNRDSHDTYNINDQSAMQLLLAERQRADMAAFERGSI